MVAPATQTGFQPSHVGPGQSRTLHWRWDRTHTRVGQGMGQGTLGCSRGGGSAPAPPCGQDVAQLWYTHWVVPASRVGLWCRGGSGSAEEPQPAAQIGRFSFPAGERRPVVWEVGQGGRCGARGVMWG